MSVGSSMIYEYESILQHENIPVGCIRVLITTRCQDQWAGGPQVNKFEQVSSIGYKVSLAGGRESVDRGS